jgi:serine/threonine protein phosphatase PrpC
MGAVNGVEHVEVAPFECAFAGRGVSGGESGDACLVKPSAGGTLVAVIDGLGHGPEAAAASQVAVQVLGASAQDSLAALVLRCHEALHRTRGVVMSLAWLCPDPAAVTWLGVGNVDGVLVRSRVSAALRRTYLTTLGGVVGYRLPALRATTLALSPGDVLLLATDGIGAGFADGLGSERPAQEVADAILAAHATPADDALVLAARYLGSS